VRKREVAKGTSAEDGELGRAIYQGKKEDMRGGLYRADGKAKKVEKKELQSKKST